MLTPVLLTCGHMSAMRESGHPDALLWCETCNSWQERDESNGLCLEDLPPPFSAQYDLIGDAEQKQRGDPT
jgi:hypothetical protein